MILFTDIAMTGSLTKLASKQDFHPEWIITGAQYQDVTILARSYDQDQWANAAGIANLPPAINGSTGGSLIDWYWGPTQGSVAATVQSNIVWLAERDPVRRPTTHAQERRNGASSWFPAEAAPPGTTRPPRKAGWGARPGYPTRATCRWAWTTGRSGTT